MPIRARAIAAFAALAPLTAHAEPIPDDPAAAAAPFFVGAAARARPLPAKDVERHPFLAPQGSIHVDLYNSDVTDLRTPLGVNPVVTSRRYGEIGTCLNFVFDGQGRFYAFCGVPRDGKIAFELTWLDPVTLEKRSAFPLVELTIPEIIALPLDLGYMVMDERGRFIAINPQNQALWVGVGSSGQLEVQEQRDFSVHVPASRDKIASIVPDYQGHLFYMTLGKTDGAGGVATPAVFGVVDPASGAHSQREFPGEIIENGLAVGTDGVFVLTDRALYGFAYAATAPHLRELFREPYARATRRKPGVFSFGSGSTPTLLGPNLVVISDNRDDQVHLLVYDRRPDSLGRARTVCDVPLFDPGASANENSVVATGRSIIAQNWYGAPDSILSDDHRGIVPGLMRIDVREDQTGCDVVWYTRELATPATIKLSTATGLIYGVMMDRDTAGVNVYNAHAIDFRTGRTVYKVRLGSGAAANIQFSPTYIGPDGAIYQPARAGIIKLADGAEQPGPRPDVSGGCGCGVSDARASSVFGVFVLAGCWLARSLRARQKQRLRSV
jgi:hypothetical protein